MKKCIVITSIFNPTQAVKTFAKLKDWQLIVVADRKTPSSWNCPNVIFLSPADQEEIKSKFVQSLPWNSYCRKMIGYIYAIEHGADIIADTDDDNIPYKNWAQDLSWSGTFDTLDKADFVNTYKLFTDTHIWPRGFPLNKILDKKKLSTKKQKMNVGVWQFLADEDPDVDAIYRLTNNTPVFFNQRSPVVLHKKTICPFNSQNTFFSHDLFPLLYLPAFVNFRYTDILRGLVAQPVMWQAGYHLAFGQATVIQKRNPHNYLKDFESEIPCYLYPEKVIELISPTIRTDESVVHNLFNAYEALLAAQIVSSKEMKVLSLWLKHF